MTKPRKNRVEETRKPASATPAEDSPLTSGARGCADPLSPALAADADKARPGPGDTADSVPGGPAPIGLQASLANADQVPGALVIDELIGAKQLLALVFGDEPALQMLGQCLL